MVDFASDSILVLLDVTPAGELAKSSAGLLGAAAGVGTPVALIVAGESAHADLVAAAGELGAAVVLTAGLGGADTALTVPLVDALAVSLADLDVDVDPASAPQSIMTAVSEKPPRGAGIKITDEGDAGEKLAAYLIENRLA